MKARPSEKGEIDGTQEPGYDCDPLEFLFDPGTATAEEIADLFCEMSTLYDMMGGRGVQFTVTDCREPASVEDPV